MVSIEKTECPICGAEVSFPRLPRPRSYPFCSERCQLLDLSRWLDGDYRIPDDDASKSQS